MNVVPMSARLFFSSGDLMADRRFDFARDLRQEERARLGIVVGDQHGFEHQLDRLQVEQPQLRIVRLRPGFIFKRQVATEIRRLFLGPLVPGALLRSWLMPVCPAIPGLCQRQ